MVCCAGTNDIPYGSSPLHSLTQKVFVAKWPYVSYGMEKKLGENSHFELGVDHGDFKFKVVGRIPANIVIEIV